MTRHVGRAVAGLAAVVLSVLVTGGLAVVPGPVSASASAAAPAATDDQDQLPVEVRITGVSPRVLEPGRDLRLRVEVQNTGSTPVAQPRVLVHLDRSSFISRSSLDRWRYAGTDEAVGPTVLEQNLPAALGPGQTATVDLVVQASAVRLPTRRTTWGARGLAVQVVDVADPAWTRLGLARTFALWFPEQEVTPTRVSVIVPVAGVGVDPHTGAWVAELEQLTRPGGRLADLLAATGDHPEVTWAVDPWLADAAAGAGPVAQAWAAGLLARTAGREVVLLPYLDPDLAALTHTGAGELLTTAIERAEHVADTTDLPGSARVTLAWPADDLPDLATAALAEREGHDALLVGAGQLLAPVVFTYTPSGRTTVTVDGKDLPVLVPDERLSGALLTGVVGPPDTEPSSPVTPATAAQDLLAELAVITRERPSDGRHMLLSVPRDWAADADVVTAQLDAMAAAPWVQMEPVSALVDLDDPQVDRGTLPDRVVTGTEVEAAALGTVRNAVDRREMLASITANPSALLGDLELEQLAPTSVAWRDDPVGRAESVAASHIATQAIDGRVTVVQPTGDITLVSPSGGLPVQVTNAFDQEVTLTVALRPSDNRLVADDAVPVTIPAGEQVLVLVPVHAVQSADIQVTVELRTPGGTVLDSGTRFMVRVRAEWEGIGTAVIGGLLAIGLVVGIARTIRRGRTTRRAAPQATSGPDALSPEETAERTEGVAEPAGWEATPGSETGSGSGGPPRPGPEEARHR